MCFVFVENFKELEVIIEKLKTNFKDMVNSVDDLFVTNELRLSTFPKLTIQPTSFSSPQ